MIQYARRTEKPKTRSPLRVRFGMAYHSFKRHFLWLRYRAKFAAHYDAAPLPYRYFGHETVLLRQLKDVDMHLQHNKIINLKIAAKRLDGILLRPGELLSYWKLIGRPTYRKGYVDGMVLSGGVVTAGCGGGLCQLSNLVYWMTLHTPLTVVERHRHGYDVFPDSDRTQPFGSGATCFYPHGDLMIQNNTDDTFQLRVRVGATHLEGEWRCDRLPDRRYEIIERNHHIASEYWGGYSRHNEMYRLVYDLAGNRLGEELVTENHALMMYAPFLGESEQNKTSV
jgi:vancomycin resistance protein VanW